MRIFDNELITRIAQMKEKVANSKDYILPKVEMDLAVHSELLESRAKLKRLAALEAVCREIVESAPGHPGIGLNCEQHFDIPSHDLGHRRAKYLIAQKLKAVLEEQS